MDHSMLMNTTNKLVRHTITGLLIATLCIAVNAAAANGKTLYAENACGSCHGPTGNEPIVSTYPKIAGQNKEYLIRQMNDIKSGARDNGASIAMRGLVANLDADDIIAIAEYLSSM
jgi:cytochrome c